VSSRLYPSRPFLAASVAVFRDGRVLLASRTKPPSETLFTLPGGLVEPGETLEAAALRELAEEVGVEAAIVGFNEHVEFIERDPEGRVRHHFVIASFAARWRAGEAAVGPEAEQVLWALPGDLAGLALTPGLPRILARARTMVESAG
jgi:8-oxo-dGTP diphosphatase